MYSSTLTRCAYRLDNSHSQLFGQPHRDTNRHSNGSLNEPSREHSAKDRFLAAPQTELVCFWGMCVCVPR